MWRVSPPFLMECDPPALLASVNPTTPRTSLPRHGANLRCAPNRCPNKPLSGGGGGNLGPWREKNAAIFMARPWLPYSWGPLFGWRPPGSDTHFQQFRFPGLLKRSDEKRWGWGGVRWSKKPAAVLRRGCWALSAGTSSHTGSAVLVQTQYVLSHSRSRSTSLPQASSL